MNSSCAYYPKFENCELSIRWLFVGTIMGFEPLVNQRLLPPSFPRYTAIFSREQVRERKELVSLVEQFRACSISRGSELRITFSSSSAAMIVLKMEEDVK